MLIITEDAKQKLKTEVGDTSDSSLKELRVEAGKKST